MHSQIDRLNRTDGFPMPSTPFIGRHREIVEITALLADPNCRLLTLVGPGGIGKTRLAVEVVSQRQAAFADGVWLIALQSVRSIEFLVPAIADTLGVTLSGQQEPVDQLLDYLHDKELLLLLDNFEHLLAQQGESLIPNILDAAAGVRLMVTSREVLNLQEEWLYSVQGMTFPAVFSPANLPKDEIDIELYSAAQLFIERARRVRHRFSVQEELAHVFRICQLVEGMPLALELAATWTKTLRCDEIADEISRNLDFLATHLRNIPDRHRSMQAVFDHSWESLTPEQQVTFARMAVFQGGFQREAAEQIAGASLQVLSELVDKSMLKHLSDGRYQLHELLRQYAEAHLARSADAVALAQEAHYTYYTNFLRARLGDLMGGRQLEALDDIRIELDNIRVAWNRALENGSLDALMNAVHPLARFYLMQGRCLEGVNTLEKLVHYLSQCEQTETVELAMASTRVHLGNCYSRLGKWDTAKTIFEQCWEHYTRLNVPPVFAPHSDPRPLLSVIFRMRGDFEEARRLAEAALETSELHDHPWNRQIACYALSWNGFMCGDYKAAQRYAEQAYTISQAVDDIWFTGACLNVLGNIAMEQGQYDTAEQSFKAFYDIRREFNDREGMARALKNWGEVARYRGAFQEAWNLNEQSRILYEAIHEEAQLTFSLCNLGNIATEMENYREAAAQYRRGLSIALERGYTIILMSLLIGIGSLFLKTQRIKQGVSVLVIAANHPATMQHKRDEATNLLEMYAPHVEYPEIDVEPIIEDTKSILSVIEAAAVVERPLTQTSSEILSERELEVLRLIEQGLSNQEIADKLFIGVSTVKKHINHIYSKLDADSRTRALARARELDLLQ